SLTVAEFIDLDNPANTFGGTVTYTAPGGDVTIAAAGNLTLASGSAPNELTASAGGILSENNSLSVSGATSLTGGTVQMINAGNNFAGPVSLSSTGTTTLVNSTALSVASLTLAGDASLTAAPGITFTGNLNVGSHTLTLTSTGPAHLSGTT